MNLFDVGIDNLRFNGVAACSGEAARDLVFRRLKPFFVANKNPRCWFQPSAPSQQELDVSTLEYVTVNQPEGKQ